jgi:glycosyltransferase involved in cell wall biosynthesis
MEAASRVSASPRVVLGLPAFARPDALPRALESLLSQTYRDFALVVVDDAPDAEVGPIVNSYARDYPQVSYVAKPEAARHGWQLAQGVRRGDAAAIHRASTSHG